MVDRWRCRGSPRLAPRRRQLLASGVAAAWVAAGPTIAQPAWPARPIRLLLGVPPGGTVEYIARAVQDGLEAALGQPLVLEYRAGGGGTRAAAELAQAAPDGYTLMIATTGPFAVAPHLAPAPPYDPARHFSYIGQIAEARYVAATRAEHPARDLRQFVDWARAADSRPAYASSGAGSVSHLNGERLNDVAGLELRHLPYGGSAAAMADLIAGRAQLYIETGTALLPEIRRGRLRALAITGPRRESIWPGVPAVAELGLAGLEAAGFHGLVGPQGLNERIVQRLAADLRRVLDDATVRQRLNDAGALPRARDGGDFAAVVRSQGERWAALIARRGIGSR